MATKKIHVKAFSDPKELVAWFNNNQEFTLISACSVNAVSPAGEAFIGYDAFFTSRGDNK